jgi:hypothetical protein
MHAQESKKSGELASEIARLQSAAVPRLHIATELRSDEFPGFPGVKLYRLGIENLASQRVENVEAKIIAILAQGDQTVRDCDHRLRDTGGVSEWSINPAITKYVDLVATRSDKNPPRIYFGPYAPGLSVLFSQGAGLFFVTVEVSCATAGAIKKTIALKFDGSLVAVGHEVT